MSDPKAAGEDAPIRISACIMARDEERNLPGCLASVAFCDEVLVVDSGSSDATVEIARAAGARVFENPWRGFAAQRNFLLDRARGRWVLEVDADERVTPRLQEEIERFLADPPAGVKLCGLPLREIFLGGALGPSAKYPKYRHRMLLRGSARHDERRTVHEGFVPAGPVHPFEGDLLHLLAESWGEAIGDAWRYARLEAGQLAAAPSAAAVLTGMVLRPAAKLLYRLFVDGGWRDGWRGLAKIAIDCGTDSVVWARCALGARGEVRGESGVVSGEHYGAWKRRLGSLRLAGVALGRASAAEASEWLRRAAAAGADVVLLAPSGTAAAAGADGAPSGAGGRVRVLAGPGPLQVIRGLEAEEQLRTLDAVVPFGAGARLALRVVPRGLRGPSAGVDARSDPAALGSDLQAFGREAA